MLSVSWINKFDPSEPADGWIAGDCEVIGR